MNSKIKRISNAVSNGDRDIIAEIVPWLLVAVLAMAAVACFSAIHRGRVAAEAETKEVR